MEWIICINDTHNKFDIIGSFNGDVIPQTNTTTVKPVIIIFIIPTEQVHMNF